MKAAYITKYGGPEVQQYGELPDPVMEEGTILVRVKAVSVNPVDYKLRDGVARIVSGNKFPKVLGHDFSGIIEQVSSGISDFKTGDAVYGYISVIFGKPGAMAELAVVKPKNIRKIPDGMTFEEAASIPVAALTVLAGFRKSGELNGKRVLVSGATGGVGHFAVQVAKARGAEVTAMCSTKNTGLAKQLGADHVIDYTQQSLSSLIEKFDVIFDAYGKMPYTTACRLLNKKGVFSSTLFGPTGMISSLFVKALFNKKLTSANMRGRQEDYREIEELFLSGKVKPLIENYFSLEKAGEAFDMAENGRPRGKIIIRP